MRVLLVEDHAATGEGTARLLADEGATVVEASDGRAALELVRRGDIDVILLDMMLPDFDGREVLKAIQSRRPPGLKGVLVLTGDLTQERLDEVRRLVGDALIGKPIDVRCAGRDAADVPPATRRARRRCKAKGVREPVGGGQKAASRPAKRYPCRCTPGRGVSSPAWSGFGLATGLFRTVVHQDDAPPHTLDLIEMGAGAPSPRSPRRQFPVLGGDVPVHRADVVWELSALVQ